jgi:hypothetical protein
MMSSLRFLSRMGVSKSGGNSNGIWLHSGIDKGSKRGAAEDCVRLPALAPQRTVRTKSRLAGHHPPDILEVSEGRKSGLIIKVEDFYHPKRLQSIHFLL